jgi:glyoxylase-like metal-dependent hydrolase (beta-lactamase superfamily II)
VPAGGTAPAVFNAANEVAVAAFLKKQVPYLAIPRIIEKTLGAEEHRTILFETGVGAFFEPRLRDRFGVVGGEHRLLASLRAVGAAPEDVDVVVLSHLHFDHAGGLLAAWEQDRPPRLVFPKARYVTSEAAFRRAEAPHPRDRASFIPELQPLLAPAELIDVVPLVAADLRGDKVSGGQGGDQGPAIGADRRLGKLVRRGAGEDRQQALQAGCLLKILRPAPDDSD